MSRMKNIIKSPDIELKHRGIIMRLLLFFVVVAVATVAVEAFFPSIIPPYCSRDMSSKRIRPLAPAEAEKVEALIQVQAMFRHGARIPWRKNKCWKGYSISWNHCNVHQLSQSQMDGVNAIGGPVFFRKVFDASPNQFGGNCLTGQLLDEGYIQEKALGEILKEAYVDCQSTGASCFPVLESNIWENVSEKVYFRADDESRVIMSGQLVVSSLFNFTTNDPEKPTIIDIRTGEFALDQIYPNVVACPELRRLETEALESEEFLSVSTGHPVVDMERQLSAIFGGKEGDTWAWDNFVDCSMTAICTGRPLPNGTADRLHVMTEELFWKAYRFGVWKRTFMERYNSAAFSRKALGVILWQIRNRIQNVISDADYIPKSMADEPSHPLFLYAAHDTSIMAILASLLGDAWDGSWANYAAMLVLEIYRGKPEINANADSMETDSETSVEGEVNSNIVPKQGPHPYYFRLVYEGSPIMLPGCEDFLCDVKMFFKATEFTETEACFPDRNNHIHK